MNWGIVLGSAAVGALVSSGITMWGQYLERKSRREELILTKAIEMAHTRFEHVKDIPGAQIPPEIKMAEDYHRWLKYLMNHGKLPNDFKGQPMKNSDKTIS